MDTNIACCFTGPRPKNLPWGSEENDLRCRRTREVLALAIEYAWQDGYRQFYSGMAQGIDLIAAELVLQSREIHPDIQLVAAIPYAGQTKKWRREQIERYYGILQQCTPENIHVLAPAYMRNCMQIRNRYLADHCQRIIAVYDGRSGGGTKCTLTYALKKNLEAIIIDPNAPHIDAHTRR